MKLELEAVLKLEKWDELDDLFEQCWKYKSPDHYETLADLVLVIHSCVVGAGLDVKYERSKFEGQLPRNLIYNKHRRDSIRPSQNHRSHLPPGWQ